MEDNSFLPQDYKQPELPSNYTKLETGDVKLRILKSPLLAWVDWIDNKPVRFPMNAKPEKPFDPTKEIKFVWILLVYNYNKKAIQILELTQNGIQKTLTGLAQNPDWKSPILYDITINKTGEKLKTKYVVTPSPPKEMSEEVENAMLAKPVKLEALFTNGDPFATT